MEPCRPGGLKNDPPSEVGNLILRNEDTLFAKKSDPATAISRDTVSLPLNTDDQMLTDLLFGFREGYL